MTVCEICWEAARIVWLESGMSQTEAYRKILSNQRDVHELEAENARLRDALKEIAKREGPFSIDQLKHAGNVIESMGNIADEALKETE